MAEVTRARTLDLEEDLEFQNRQWRAATILWVLLVALMIGTAAGLFGDGLVSRARAETADAALSVEYQRIVRFGASVRWIVHVRPQQDGFARVAVDRSLLQAFRVQHVTPVPSSSTIIDGGVSYRFQTDTPETVAIVFELQPAARWTVEGEIRAPDGAVRLTQFVLP